MTENMGQNTLGLRIAECRRKSNLTQEELANRLGVTPQALSQYERGTRYPDIELLKGLCEILHVSADYLLGVELVTILEKDNPKIQEEIWRALRSALEPLKLMFGEEIIPLFMQEDYLELISVLRLKLAKDGILMPIVRIMDQSRLKPREFIITAYDNIIYQEIVPNNQGISVNYIIQKLEDTIQKHYDEIINPDIIKNMVDNLKINYSALINNVVPEHISYIQLTNICKLFIRKGNSLIYLPKIIEILSDLQRDNIERNDMEVLDIMIQRIKCENNFRVYLAKKE